MYVKEKVLVQLSCKLATFFMEHHFYIKEHHFYIKEQQTNHGYSDSVSGRCFHKNEPSEPQPQEKQCILSTSIITFELSSVNKDFQKTGTHHCKLDIQEYWFFSTVVTIILDCLPLYNKIFQHLKDLRRMTNVFRELNT